MKFRSFIWLSALALVMLLLVQYIFINETFKTKKEQFDSKYTGLSKLGLYQYENQYLDLQYDSILNLLDDYSYFALYDLGFAVTPQQKDSLKILILDEFKYQLDQSMNRTFFLRAYLENQGEDSDFITAKLLREVALISFEQDIPVFQDTIGSINPIEKDGSLLNTYTVERNHFRMKYDYYISFTQRSERIAREMRLTKVLAVSSLLIVFGVFFLTLRNLFIQRRLSELKTDFINNMTHELKTPLSTISVASSSLNADNGPLDQSKVKRISEIIKKQNRHLSQLIDRILDISIWEKDQVKILPEPVDIQKFFNQVSDDFKTAHPDADFRIEINTPLEKTSISLDKVHITTVINNLLSNALKYGGQPPTIQLHVTVKEKLYIRITDNGTGISELEKPHIFEKFYRGKETKEKAIRGLGLGLYYVKQIIEAHNGKIYIEKSDSKGTVFTIEIPR